MSAFRNLTGQRFGRLTVLEKAPSVGRNGRWLCSCECGQETIAETTRLKSGKTRSCGCLKIALNDLTGQRFGRLVATSRAPNVGKSGKVTAWNCRCDCGAATIVPGDSLKRGASQSCGCLNKERVADSSRARAEDHTGRRFGKLTAIRRGDYKGKDVGWICRCDCGTEKTISVAPLRRGLVVSCGCENRRIASARMLEMNEFRQAVRVMGCEAEALEHHEESTEAD